MGGMPLTRDIPVSGTDSFNIPTVRFDVADGKRDAWLNIANVVQGPTGTKYRLRVAAIVNGQAYAMGRTADGGDTGWEVELGYGEVYSVGFPHGTQIVEATRIPASGATEPYSGSLSYVVVRGPVNT